MKYSILVIFISLVSFGCGNKNQGSGDPFANCKFGKPEPVFSIETPKISSHDFRLTGKEGIEKVVFENGVRLEVIQSGCDAARQEFQFTLMGNFANASTDSWILKAIEHFQYMGALSDEFAPFSFWAGAMEQMPQHYALGQPFEVQPGAFVTIDKIFSPDYTILIVVLSQQEN